MLQRSIKLGEFHQQDIRQISVPDSKNNNWNRRKSNVVGIDNNVIIKCLTSSRFSGKKKCFFDLHLQFQKSHYRWQIETEER